MYIFLAIIDYSICQRSGSGSRRYYGSEDPSVPTIPIVIRGAWFSREKNVNTFTEFDDRTMRGRGYLVDVRETHHVNYTFIFQQDNCFHCVRIFVRTVNILEKMESKE